VKRVEKGNLEIKLRLVSPKCRNTDIMICALPNSITKLA
jgi:hypothetical protein